MRDIHPSDAKTHLPQILDAVERAETTRITHHGRAIARIVPEVDHRQQAVDQAIDNLKALGRRTGKIKVQDLLTARHEGHRH